MWNSLSVRCKDVELLPTFRRRLKAEPFNTAYQEHNALPVASPGFVMRRGKEAVNLVMGTYGELQGRVQQLLDD